MAKDVQLQGMFDAPGIVPVLSAGKHRRPAHGACFMEFASYLAGEQWSDHPPCTHPLLAFLARGINDFTSDEGRQKLASLIPSVIGITSSDPRLDVVIALRAACTALPVVSESRQRGLASGIIGCERMLVAIDGTVTDAVAGRVAEATAAAPHAWAWAEHFSAGFVPRRVQTFTRQGRAIVSTAVLGVSQACIDDSDAVLALMLRDAIADAAAFVSPAADLASVSEPSEQQNVVAWV